MGVLKSMFENSEGLEELIQFEKHIASKSNINTQYAFSVILSEKEYKNLKKIFINNNYFQLFPENFPWCHIKLLTETYVRVIQNFNIKKTHTRDELSKYLNFILTDSIWNNLPNSLKKINLTHTRDEGGPWWIVANIRLHAGIPIGRLHEIIEFLKEKYKKHYYSVDEAITYLSSYSYILENMHFSKYVKEAFSHARTRKMLFSWLLKIIDFIQNHNINDLIDNPNIPPHLIDYFTTNPIKESSILKPKRIKQNSYQGIHFQEETRIISYIKLVNKSLKKNIIGPDFFPLDPDDGDIDSNLFFSNRSTDIVEALIFDSLGHILVPEDGKIRLNDNKIIIITKNKVIDILNKPLDMDDDWWGWYLYYYELQKNCTIEFGKPYGRIEVNSRDYNFNYMKWISDTVIKQDYFYPVFGGIDLPIFFISSDDVFSEPTNIWISIFCSNKCLIRSKAVFIYDENENRWVWQPPEFTESDDEYYISVKLYNFQFESDMLQEKGCIWLKGFKFEVKPSRPLFPDETCTIILEGLSYQKINSKLKNIKFRNIKQVEYQFSEKPKDFSPIIGIKTQNGMCDLIIKLGYISCYIQYQNYNNKIVSIDLLRKPVSDLEMKKIVEQDFNSKLIILCLDNDSILSLYSKDEKIKEITFNNDYRDTKLLCEIQNYNNIILKNEVNNDYRIIVNDIRINTWNFKKIFNQTKSEIIFKNSYYGGN